VTVLGPADAPVAALIHDAALLERPALLEAAAAAARLALENERLQAELRAQLAELRASRARIVSAGDEERRRLERDLHDGAQQRLLSLGLALQLARAKLGPEANGAAELLDEADAELHAALDELRELARGHPQS
jgi:signal transduction histidine kinase